MIFARTDLEASGRLKYMISGHKILSRTAGDGSSVVRFPRYQLRGVVTDLESRPVVGAVVRLGSEIVITGDDGRFWVGVDRAAPVAVAVLTDEFAADGAFEVVSAPGSAVPTSQSDVRQIKIVVRRR